ncbi:hypothetical protein GCM10027578_07520 [Spirosoma luteolum]
MFLNRYPVSRALLAGLTLWCALAHGQSMDESLTRLTPATLSGLPGNWKPAGSLLVNPQDAGTKTTSGNTVLVGSAGQPVTLLTGARDVRLLMEVMLSPGADAQLLVSGAPIRLADNWGTAGVNARTIGTVTTGTAELPTRSTGRAPGLWQQVELLMESGRKPAVLAQLKLNGVLIQENLVLPNLPQAAAGTVAIQVNNGTVAVRNIGYQLVSDRKVASLNNLRYQFYEAKTETTSPEALKNLKMIKEDTTSTLSYEVSYGQPRWHAIVYTGDLTVDKAGTYTIALQNGGYAGLDIDGKSVIANTYQDLGKMNTARINLSAGKHPIKLFYGRSWPRPGFGLFIAAPDTKFQTLHAPASLPEPDPVGTIAVPVRDEPVLIRSFVQLPGEARKRTHCLSVGTPSGLHYTVDLNQDALLQVWRGDFADATEMWYERGEPQLLEPMGSPVRLAPQSAVALLSNAQQAWPDTMATTDFTYKGLKLDQQGHPTTRYRYRDIDVTDALLPTTDGKALNRTLTLSGSGNGSLYCRLATGQTIDEVAKGLYAIDDHRYYVRLDPKQKATLRTSNGRQELLMPVSGNGNTTIQYAYIW